MPGWIDLKFWMAVCWKMSWNDDPLPLSVPLRLPDEPLGVLDDELQAARPKAAATRTAPAAAPWMRTRGISDIPSQLPAECCDEDGLCGMRPVPGLVQKKQAMPARRPHCLPGCRGPTSPRRMGRFSTRPR